MAENSGDLRGTEFDGADLSGARFRKTYLNDAVFRMCDLSGVVMRDLSLSGASIDGCELDGLLINGVEVGPLIEAELVRREPARALRRAEDPAGLRAAWAALQQSWAATFERVAAMPAGTTDVSVRDEWSFAQTVRHLVFATDAWLGAIQRDPRPFHPWGQPFSELAEFASAADLGFDETATPSYAEVLDMRADRVAKVDAFLADVTPERLAEEVEGPVWENGRKLSVLRCLRVILNEECEHLRFARRDLDAIEAAAPVAAG